jgi:hypothetical protein
VNIILTWIHCQGTTAFSSWPLCTSKPQVSPSTGQHGFFRKLCTWKFNPGNVILSLLTSWDQLKWTRNERMVILSNIKMQIPLTLLNSTSITLCADCIHGQPALKIRWNGSIAHNPWGRWKQLSSSRYYLSFKQHKYHVHKKFRIFLYYVSIIQITTTYT